MFVFLQTWEGVTKKNVNSRSMTDLLPQFPMYIHIYKYIIFLILSFLFLIPLFKIQPSELLIN